MERPLISYAITVCNEHVELERLLNVLVDDRGSNVEIVVLADLNNTPPQVFDMLNDFRESEHMFRYYTHDLNKDFATHKNYLNSVCLGKWIVQLDADEYPHIYLLKNIHTILQTNRDVDAIWVPRVNTVDGLTDEDVSKWGWHVNDTGYVNFPDFQMRIFKNNPEIKWVKPVHEQLTGYKTWSALPGEEQFALYHPKHIDRQRTQNEFYDTI
jgi:hypothetical protein